MDKTTPLAQRITQGPITAKVNAIDAPDGRRIALVLNTTEWRANTELIAEAFNTAHETGLTPRQLADKLLASVEDNSLPCPTCSHVPDTHRKRQVRHLHCKSEGMVKFITELQGVLGVTGGFKRMIAAVKDLKERAEQ